MWCRDEDNVLRGQQYEVAERKLGSRWMVDDVDLCGDYDVAGRELIEPRFVPPNAVLRNRSWFTSTYSTVPDQTTN